MNPRLSIVLPTYGVEAYIGNALDCLLAQTASDFEIIVVNDATKDRSAKIATEYSMHDDRIHIINHEVNRGLSAARNTGLEAATGDYVWFPDPDDEYAPTLVERVLKATQNEPDLVLFGHCDQIIDPDGTIVSITPFIPGSNHEGKLLDASTFQREVLDLERHTMLGYAWNKAYNRETIGTLRFLDDKPLVEDILFNVSFCETVSSAVLVPEVLYRYKKRNISSLTSKFVPEYYEMHRLRIQSIRDMLNTWNLLDAKAKGTLGGIYVRYILSALERNRDERSGLNAKQQRAWCFEVSQDPLYLELVVQSAPHNSSKATIMARKALVTLRPSLWNSIGGILHAAKSKSGATGWSAKTSNK